MNRSRTWLAERGALELIEESVHLLRSVPGATLATYYVGSVPFILGLLYYWADMSGSTFAYERCASGAAGVTLLFLWMKGWQALFAGRLGSHLRGDFGSRWNMSRAVRVFVVQAFLQPSGLFLLPIALVITLPFAWTYAFYQNVTALGSQETPDTRAVFGQASRQSRLWPKQNHILLAVLSLFGVVVFVNLAIAILQLPQLLNTLFAIDTLINQSGWSMLNTTFFLATGCMTYLLIDPLIKAAYVLRCFYGEALQSGADLKIELKQCRSTRPTLGMAALFLFFLIRIDGASAAGAGAPDFMPRLRTMHPFGVGTRSTASELLIADIAGAVERVPTQVVKKIDSKSRAAPSSQELDHAIESVINKREYSWRLPRPAVPPEKRGFLAAFLESVADTIRGWARSAWDALRSVLEWVLERLFKHLLPNRTHSSGMGWMGPLQILLYVLLAAVACVLAIFVMRVLKRRVRSREQIVAEPIAPTPDLTDQNIVANQLPEEGWLQLAAEMIERGDLRLALRAFYLASLAHLARRELIRIAKFKSNHEYELELCRRARAQPELHAAFAQNVGMFDRAWYGMGEVTRDLLAQFRANLGTITAC